MTHKHSAGSPCECEKLKNAEREELREGLKKCVEARETERREREAENARRADEAEAEVKSLKKKLIAFQLATAVGGAVIGQEAVNKITEKMDAARELQGKITGEAAPAADAPAPVVGGKDKISFSGWKPYLPKNKSMSEPQRGNGDISGVFAGSYTRSQEPLPIVPPPANSVAADISTTAFAPRVAPPLDTQALSQNLMAAFSNPLPPTLQVTWDAPLLPFNDSSGFAFPAAGGVVPSPAPITLFAMSGLIHNRRRA